MTRSSRQSAWHIAPVVLALVAFTAWADVPLDPPQQVIQRVSDGLMQVLRTDRDLLRTDPTYVRRLVDELLLPNLDVDRLSALVLGPYWRETSLNQRDAFQDAFKTLLVQTYASALDRLDAWEIRYRPMRLESDGTRALVRTEILQPGRAPVAVDYRMRLTEDRWVAYDVVVEGISLLAAYRGQFTDIARRKGVDGLIAELTARNATGR